MKLSKKSGYTLIEMVMILTLIAILSFGMAVFIVNSMQAWILISGWESAVTTARKAMDRMVAELRRIKKPENILVYTTAEVQFLDIDANTVDFKQSGTNLLRNTAVLATGLASPEGLRFTYLNATGEVTGIKQDMRSIRVWLSLSSGAQRTTLESSARIRNL